MSQWKKILVSGSNAELNHITTSGNINASGYISASNFVGSGSGLVGVPIFITGSDGDGSVSNPFTHVSKSFQRLHFDYHSGIHVSESSPSTAFISLGSAFHIFSASNGIARSTGSDEIIFEAGDNMTVEVTQPNDPTNPTGHHKITFTSTGGEGSGFPYSGSDIITSLNNSQAVITGSLLLGGGLGGHITASGDISASGTISANTFIGLPSGIISGASQLPSGIISGASQLPNGIISGAAQLPDGIISGSTQLPSLLPSGIYSSSLQILTNVTASGNISASGTISANTFQLNGFNFTTVESLTTVISGSTQFGSGSSGSAIPLTTHEFTGSILITGSGIFPDTNGSIDLGDYNRKFSNLYAVNTFFGGVHEINLETEGLDQMQEGTVLSLKDGALHPCEKEADPLVMGVVSKESNFPIVLGAEPVLVTGKIKSGDYIITSKVKGHGKGINPRYIYSKQLFGKIIAQAIEDGKGKSYLIKAMIRKM